MESAILKRLTHRAFTNGAKSKKERQPWRRLMVGTLLAVLLHLFFAFGLAPFLRLNSEAPSRTEVVEISPQELAQIKRKILHKDVDRIPLMPNELKEEYRVKETPKNARMMGKFNQQVPEETVAGAQHDAPEQGGGHRGKQPKPSQKPEPKLKLSELGLAHKPLPKPIPSEQLERNLREEKAGPPGPEGVYRPRGLEDKNLRHGDENLLNAAENQYYSFFERLNDPIIRNWYFLVRSGEYQLQQDLTERRIRPGAELVVTIELVMDRKGNFNDVRVLESSGIPSFDRFTVEAIRKVGSAPNPPPELFKGQPYFSRSMSFELIYSEGAAGQWGRPDLYW